MTHENDSAKPEQGLCREPHDLALSKLVAGREKDCVLVSGVFCNRAKAHFLTLRVSPRNVLLELQFTDSHRAVRSDRAAPFAFAWLALS